MNYPLFPREIIENSAENHFSKNSKKSSLIYISILVIVITALILLPFIEVDVGVRSQGVVRPVSEIKPLISLMSGRLDSLAVEINDFVQQGSIIARLASPVIDEKLKFNQARKKQVEYLITDLSSLLRLDSASVMHLPQLNTPHYRNSHFELRHKLQQALQRYTIASGEVNRHEMLYQNGYVSHSQFEDIFFTWKSAISGYHLVLEQQKNIWQSDLHRYLDEFDRLNAEKKQLKTELEFYTVRSPVAGTIQNVAGIAPGIFIYSNQVIAEVTPDTSLIIDVYVSPKDIGLIRKQMKVRLQVSSFNHNQWGVLDGTVSEVSEDVIMVGTVPVFRVRCHPDRTWLSLSNGYRGYLKKGMTVKARFIVTRRSILQLLYDKVDDWINPFQDEPDFTDFTNTL